MSTGVPMMVPGSSKRRWIVVPVALDNDGERVPTTRRLECRSGLSW
jgi:hypothetical protein